MYVVYIKRDICSNNAIHVMLCLYNTVFRKINASLLLKKINALVFDEKIMAYNTKNLSSV